MRPCCPITASVSTPNRSSVLDACQLSTPGAWNVHCAEGRTGVNETVGIAGGVGVVAGDLAGVVDAERGRARGEGKLIGVNTPAWSRNPWEAVASDHCPTMSPGSVDPGSVDPGGDGPGGR